MEFAHPPSSLSSGPQRTSLADGRHGDHLQISNRPSGREPRSSPPTRGAPSLGEATETQLSRSTAVGLAIRSLGDSRSALLIVKPETVLGWHRKGFRSFWTWKVHRGQSWRPAVSKEIRQLIRQMSRENPLWGAPRIHGELLKLGIDIGETNVGKYLARRPKPPSQTWKTFLENHVKTMRIVGTVKKSIDTRCADSRRATGPDFFSARQPPPLISRGS
jgi:hypothetical protein